ncbi:lamin tail domain-containing protein [Brachybacterium sp. J144]|uniref:lamin tail domain-containing protein n=1 Tax=Brachybacterium sp. J144 TaxID=3116487 RepID=UPI002E78D7AB|nr:lamin tail domain-containing protein [Brachybacterium sp. J144]MEE1650146.1 lamin tail domain-containing protein [Brachybacterium sp. J144]
MFAPALSRARLLPMLLAGLLLAAPLAVTAPAEAAVVKPLDITTIHYDPKGTDKSNNAGYTQEYIQVKNTGKTTLTLTGYVLRDEGPQRFAFPKGTKLAPGKTLTIRSGSGKNSSTTLYWSKASYIWNNTGDTARLYNAKGTLVEKCTYKGGTKKATKTTARTTATTAYC